MAKIVGSCRNEECQVGARGACALGKNPLDCDWFDPFVTGVGNAPGERRGTSPSPPPIDDADDHVDSAEAKDEANDMNGAPEVIEPIHDAELPAPPVPSSLRNQVVFSDRSVEIRPMAALGSVHADDVLAQEAASVILLIGPAKSGKTTLIARLLEQFERGPIGNWSFAGSQSLLGFMRRSYLAKQASGSPYATTLRTRHAEIETPWLHLRMHNGSRAQALLIADVSGEYFRNLASGADLGEASGIAERADHLVYLMDCATYLSPRTRQQVVISFRGMARRIAEGGLCATNAKHTILMTKFDCLEDADVAEGLKAELEGIASMYLDRAPVLVSAARPKDHSEAVGIVELIDVLAGPLTQSAARVTESSAASIPKPLAKLASVGGELSDLVGAEGCAE